MGIGLDQTRGWQVALLHPPWALPPWSLALLPGQNVAMPWVPRGEALVLAQPAGT